MTLETLNLSLSSELIQKAKQLMDNSDSLEAFITDAIVHEIERRQKIEPQHDFWENLDQLRDEIKSEELDLNPDDIWNNVRDPEPGREVIL